MTLSVSTYLAFTHHYNMLAITCMLGVQGSPSCNESKLMLVLCFISTVMVYCCYFYYISIIFQMVLTHYLLRKPLNCHHFYGVQLFGFISQYVKEITKLLYSSWCINNLRRFI